MNGALLIRWGANVPGREAKGLESFGRAVARFEELSKQGRVHSHREYFSVTGPQEGFMLVDGDMGELLRILAEEETLRLNVQAEAVVSDFEIQVFSGGDEQSVQQLMGNYTTSMQEAGYM